MKWTKISYQDWDDLQKTERFCQFLFDLDIKSADEACGDVHGELEDFCSQCKSQVDHCECNQDRDYCGIDEDALYDRWKDEQMEREDG